MPVILERKSRVWSSARPECRSPEKPAPRRSSFLRSHAGETYVTVLHILENSGEKPLGGPMGMKAAGIFPLDEGNPQPVRRSLPFLPPYAALQSMGLRNLLICGKMCLGDVAWGGPAKAIIFYRLLSAVEPFQPRPIEPRRKDGDNPQKSTGKFGLRRWPCGFRFHYASLPSLPCPSLNTALCHPNRISMKLL